MSRTGWKRFERRAASSCDAKRFPANTGGRMDFKGDYVVGQCKEVKRMSLHEIEALAEEAADVGHQSSLLGTLVIKRSAGKPTPVLHVMVDVVWRKLFAAYKWALAHGWKEGA